MRHIAGMGSGRVTGWFIRSLYAPLVLLAAIGSASADITLMAINDFTKTPTPGFVDYVDDPNANALMINTLVAENRNKWAAARHVFTGPDSTYDLVLYALAETDGESSYRILLNGKQIGPQFTNPSLNLDTSRRQEVAFHIVPWTALRKNDTLLIESNSVSNGKVADFSRGRWRKLVLAPSKAAKVTQQPLDNTVFSGSPARFNALATGSGTLTYAWYREGVSASVGTGANLEFQAGLADTGARYFCVISAGATVDTTRRATLSVKDPKCLPAFDFGADTLKVDEGQPVQLKPRTTCVDSYLWEIASGAGPRILDPESRELVFNASRVAGDSLVGIRVTGQYGPNTGSKLIYVRVLNAIPDPLPSLPAQEQWPAAARKVLRPAFSNRDALNASAYHPAIRFSWVIPDLFADTAYAGDTLVLTNPSRTGSLKVRLCVDNGGAQNCAESVLNVNPGAPSNVRNRMPGVAAVTAARFDARGRSVQDKRPDSGPSLAAFRRNAGPSR